MSHLARDSAPAARQAQGDRCDCSGALASEAKAAPIGGILSSNRQRAAAFGLSSVTMITKVHHFEFDLAHGFSTSKFDINL
jgi:hypothetical protein